MVSGGPCSEVSGRGILGGPAAKVHQAEIAEAATQEMDKPTDSVARFADRLSRLRLTTKPESRNLVVFEETVTSEELRIRDDSCLMLHPNKFCLSLRVPRKIPLTSINAQKSVHFRTVRVLFRLQNTNGDEKGCSFEKRWVFVTDEVPPLRQSN